jgi:putative tryptophan/tyrosine transport system substrate-binding protein
MLPRKPWLEQTMQFDRPNRREFIAFVGGAAVMWPLAGRAQQASSPVVALLSSGRLPESLIGIFRQGLAEQGYLEGRNVMIDYRHGDNHYEHLAGLAAEFARRQVAVIAALNSPPALAAKAATTTIPVVFMIPDDPVKLGLVASLSRPGGNATGVSFMLSDLGPKQLGLLRELVPDAKRIGLLVNPHNANVEDLKKEIVMAASAIGVDLKVVEASESREIDLAFAALVDNRVGALVVGTDSLFFNRRVQITTLAARHVLPAIYNAYDYAEAGGLMSYGTSLPEAFRQTGVYAGRIIKGEKPADLPVVQSAKFVFAINLPTARALGLNVPPTLLARADEVIE